MHSHMDMGVDIYMYGRVVSMHTNTHTQLPGHMRASFISHTRVFACVVLFLVLPLSDVYVHMQTSRCDMQLTAH